MFSRSQLRDNIVVGMLATALIVFPVSACGKSEAVPQVQPPLSSSKFDDHDYLEVAALFQEAGFTNVKMEPIPDLVLGWLVEDGEVEEISIGGDTEFTTGERFDPSVPVIIRYHTFPEDASPSPMPEGSATASPLPATVSPTPMTVSPSVSPVPKAPQTTGPAPTTTTATLTAENNEDLAVLLMLKDPFDPSVASFAATYKNQVIEFDGCVVAVAQHGSTKTRFDYLLSAGDYDPDSASGPSFQFSDINYYDFRFPSETAPESVPVGANLHFVAKVGQYDPATGLFQLDPIATTVR
ncbi:DUF4839 domain-containing protein [Actinomyces slackii]|uniref:DUF4839 domain-containing protein n=1 Tax=Actinomyces slackii TaxID=52774 RepID=A0A3S4WL09_9ACTO|nr:DUF4839 domain-containing protein [Actinomyces slackii]VEG75187.1 Uncharacterised protein [Actinomyces slackii]